MDLLSFPLFQILIVSRSHSYLRTALACTGISSSLLSPVTVTRISCSIHGLFSFSRESLSLKARVPVPSLAILALGGQLAYLCLLYVIRLALQVALHLKQHL
jgi:hypothetical protein